MCLLFKSFSFSMNEGEESLQAKGLGLSQLTSQKPKKAQGAAEVKCKCHVGTTSGRKL